MTVACVLRSGGIYTEEWVAKLERATRRFLDPTRFVCLSDVPVPCERIPLEHDWPGWWAKMELFRPRLMAGPVLFLDLDTLVMGSLEDVAAYSGRFALLSDFYHPDRGQSAVMAWTPGDETRELFRTFVAAAPQYVARFRSDQDFINAVLPSAARLQDHVPGQIVSLKVHAREAPPPGARLVCAHGEPRLHTPEAGWAHDTWIAT